MPVRNAEAQWNGNLREGQGTMQFNGYSGPYSFTSRFEEGAGTNPEELIGAAHAGCFSMAFAVILADAGFQPVSVRTTARVHIGKSAGGFTITASDLHTEAQVPNIDNETFQRLADDAKKGCPVSRALAGVKITLEAILV